MEGKLYSYKGYHIGDPESYEDTYDFKVYQHYIAKSKQTSDIKESLAHIFHDHSINDGMDDFLGSFEEKSIVGIMRFHEPMRITEKLP